MSGQGERRALRRRSFVHSHVPNEKLAAVGARHNQTRMERREGALSNRALFDFGEKV